MSKHLSDEQLLNQQFQLSGSAEGRRVQEHLAGCSDCARRAQELADRFSALDELKGQPEVSEQSIADILRAVRTSKPEPRSYPLLTRVLYFATPAAVLVLLATLFMPTQSGMPPEVRDMIAAQSAEQATELKVVSLVRGVGAAARAVPTRPILGKTAVMVLAKATPVFEQRQWDVADKDSVGGRELEQEEHDAKPMLVMKGLSGGVGEDSPHSPRRASSAPAATRIERETKLAGMMAQAEAPMERASVAAPAVDSIQSKDQHKHDYSCTCDVKKDESAGIDVPMSRIFKPEREAEAWTSMSEESPVRITSEPVGEVDANRVTTAWKVTVQNLSDKLVDVDISRPLLNREWSARVADDGVTVKSADEENIRFALTVDPRATKTFVYEIHTALPASGGAVENANKMEGEQ